MLNFLGLKNKEESIEIELINNTDNEKERSEAIDLFKKIKNIRNDEMIEEGPNLSMFNPNLSLNVKKYC
ncbi:hypothetical protein [Vibrio injensis]|uniref:hypothetical protein n=1 Tax=Vibrio injensis TaxID=1307414 RepID=UPI00278C0FFB|nr:hypothetical protein [Vibrio injensis]